MGEPTISIATLNQPTGNELMCFETIHNIYTYMCVSMYVYIFMNSKAAATNSDSLHELCWRLAEISAKFATNPKWHSKIYIYVFTSVCVCVYYSIAECIQHIAAVYVVVVMQRCKT